MQATPCYPSVNCKIYLTHSLLYVFAQPIVLHRPVYIVCVCVCVCVCMLVVQSCPTLCNPMDCSLPGSSVHGILQARILEWVAMPFSRGSSPLRDQTHAFYIFCIAGRFFFTAEPPGKCPLQYTHSNLQNLYSNNKSRELSKGSKIHAYCCCCCCC